jgi:dienelactone hydrolase
MRCPFLCDFSGGARGAVGVLPLQELPPEFIPFTIFAMTRNRTRTEPTLNLSPSLNHRQVMKNMTQSLAYDGGDVSRWQQTLRRKLKSLIGMPEKDDAPLKVRSLWKRETRLGTIEKIAFEVEPKCDLLAYWCVPREALSPRPAMICLQGHSTGMHNSIGVEREDESKAMKVEGDRDFAIGAMQRGVAALCIEQRSFGLRREQHQEQVSSHPCHDAVMHALMLGRTLAGERVFDVDRGLDYLAQRGDVDMKRVGVMGNSGGGTITMYAAALLPRLSFAMPSCSFCTFADSIMSIYHCGDNYIPGILQYAEAADVMGLFAPKPLVVVTGREDPIFPLPGVRKAFRDLQRIYEAAGAKENCRLAIGEGGHRFYADDGWPKLLKMI